MDMRRQVDIENMRTDIEKILTEHAVEHGMISVDVVGDTICYSTQILNNGGNRLSLKCINHLLTVHPYMDLDLDCGTENGIVWRLNIDIEHPEDN